MPTLKQISCSLELGSSTRLKEYDHRYTDGGVEAFVAVPDTQIPFHIRVTSSGYIAPGLAVYVFMDGAYQCNRNRQRLAIPGPGTNPSETEVDFKLRQKEEKTSEGTFVAREWTFAQLKTGNADRAPDINPSFASNVGTIEVVVLRCKEGGAREDAVDPAHAVADLGPQSRAASVVKAASVMKPASVARAPSKVSAAKAPSVAKAPSKAPTKVASEVGGLFGLFDGAADCDFDDYYNTGFDGAQDFDKHGYPIRSPSYVSRRPQPPEYRWDNLRGAYRHVPPRDRSPDLPSRGYEDEYHSLDVQPRHSAPPEDIPRGNSKDRGDIVFIEESAKIIVDLIIKGTGHAKRYTAMTQEAAMHRNEPEVFPTMHRALQRKAQEVTSVNQEINDLYRSIDACMRRMDKDDFQQMRNYLHQQQVYPEIQIELSTPSPTPTSRRVSLQSPRPRTASKVQSTPVKELWEEVGTGRTKPSLAEMKQQRRGSRDDFDRRRWSPDRRPRRDSDRRRRSPVRSHNGNEDLDGTDKWNDDPWNTTPAKKSSRDNDDDGWGNTSAKKTPANNDDGWGNTGANNSSRKNSAWNATPTRNSPRSDAGWPGATGSVKSASKSQKSQQSGGWGADNASAGGKKGGDSWSQQGQDAGAGADTWGNDNNGENKDDNNAGDWGGGGDAARQNDSWGNEDAKSKHSEAKQEADGWGNEERTGGDAWGNDDAAKSEKQEDANDAWGKTGGDAAKQDDNPWGATGGEGSKKSDGWGGGNDQPKSNNPSRKASSAKPAADAGWGKAASVNNGAGAWGADDQKPSSQPKSNREEPKPQAPAPRTFGNDGAQSRSSRDSAATTVSALRPVIKPYWQVWSKSPEKEKTPRPQPRDPYVYPAPPTVISTPGKAPGVNHGVQAGRGANYMHKLHQPEYLDTMQAPYAIFTFKYRSKEAVERIIKRKIDMSHVAIAVKEVEEERLMRLPKNELVAELMRRQQMSSAPKSSHASKLRGEWEKKGASRALEKKEASRAPSNNGWGNDEKAASKVASWNAEVKPSDSVSNVGSRASKKGGGGDDWAQVGTGNAAAGGGWGATSKVSKKTEEHWAADDADMKQAGGAADPW